MRRAVWLVLVSSILACNKGDSELRGRVDRECRTLEDNLIGLSGEYHKWLDGGAVGEPPLSMWMYPAATHSVESTYLHRELKFCTHVRAMDEASDNRVSGIIDVAADGYSKAQKPADAAAEIDVMLNELKKLNALPLRD
jgi:hypothetical protein